MTFSELKRTWKRDTWGKPFFKQYRKVLALALFLGLVTFVFAAGLMFTSGYLISGAAEVPDSILVLNLPLIFVRIFGAGKPALQYLERLCSHDWVLRMTSGLRLKLYRVLEADALFFRATHRTGDVLGLLAEDIGHIQNLYLRTVFPTVIAYLLYFVLIAELGFVSPFLALAMLLLLGACFLYPDNTEDLIYLLLCMSGVLLVPANAASLHMSTELQNEQEYRLSQTSMLKRQMQNYANIFQSLSEYYAQISDVQAELLANMSNALQYNADAIRKIDGYEKDTVRVAKALEGYQYDVRELSIEEPKEGCIQVCVEIANIKRGEIRTTLLPLLEVLLHRNLQIADIRNRKFMRGYHSITVCDDIPFAIDAYADSVKNSYTSSGDTFSIFRFRQSVVCMISDGMGNGERAAQSSRLITNIFQRMMVSGIPQDSAIKCINKLIQSDTYATLDVICFNRSQGVAYISKSAACPTFLLRDDQIYEINGSALPVGIISQMQPDCFQVDVKAGDEYLMISDGIYMNEIYKWLNQRTQTSVKADVESFTELLKKTRRKDDSTIVLARVDEV